MQMVIFKNCTVLITLQAAGFSHAKQDRNHCEQPSAYPSSIRKCIMPQVMHLMPILFVNKFFAEVLVQKNATFLPKALTNEQSKPSLKYCLYLICGLNIKPKFKAFLSSLVQDCCACWTQHSKHQFETVIWLKGGLCCWMSSKLANVPHSFEELLFEMFHNYYETSFNIVTQIFAEDLDFDRCKVGSLKHSSCVGERMHASLNQQLTPRNERLLCRRNQLLTGQVLISKHHSLKGRQGFLYQCFRQSTPLWESHAEIRDAPPPQKKKKKGQIWFLPFTRLQA